MDSPAVSTIPAAPALPLWQCHKVVQAAKITAIDVRGVSVFATLKLKGGARVHVSSVWHLKHQPKVGGYYVVYEDGYASYSPAAAFEAGYTRLESPAARIESPKDSTVSAVGMGVIGRVIVRLKSWVATAVIALCVFLAVRYLLGMALVVPVWALLAASR